MNKIKKVFVLLMLLVLCVSVFAAPKVVYANNDEKIIVMDGMKNGMKV